jgi:carbamoyl-phosphate synthase small subunit
MHAELVLEDGTRFAGDAFGMHRSAAGEVVFNTGMVGYPESLTDPSYDGQILVLTYPLAGNYGVPTDGIDDGLRRHFESSRICVAGLVVSECSGAHSHHSAAQSLDNWLQAEGVPGIQGIDTRALTQKLRNSGTQLGKIRCGDDVPWRDPNQEELAPRVSVRAPVHYGSGARRVAVIDCGCKNHIVRSLLARGVAVSVLPCDGAIDADAYDGVLVSNGPGDPTRYPHAIATLRELLERDRPIFGICLGHQLLALAAGGRTYKLKYGHRGQNQPCRLAGSPRCYMTAQNHGFAVDDRSLPPGWVTWFFNANDGTNEGLYHTDRPFRSVQFHPEASPGPVDTAFLFDEFVQML